MYLKLRKTYCIVNLTQDESYYPNIELEKNIDNIQKNFPSFRKLGNVFIHTPFLFKKTFPTQEIIGNLIMGEPFFISEIDYETGMVEIYQTYNGETIFGLNAFHYKETDAFKDYQFRLNYNNPFVTEYDVYGE